MNTEEVLLELKKVSDSGRVEFMASFGINPENNLGASVKDVRALGKKIGKDHKLALQLWSTTVREARMLACLLADPKLVTEEQMEAWASDFNSWELCDHCCGSLFDKTEFVYKKIDEWCLRDEEFVKRAGFALIAWVAIHDKKAEDEVFLNYLPIIQQEASDERNYVKKAVNWALRHIGKRNSELNVKAVSAAVEIKKMDSKSARWIASDAIRELTSEKVQERLLKKSQKKK
jgi:3-methyladenine DNA glycosylase AlkD